MTRHHYKAVIAIDSNDKELPRLVINGSEYINFATGSVLLECNEKTCEKAIVYLNEVFYITFTDEKWYIRCSNPEYKSITPDLPIEKTDLMLAMIIKTCKECKINMKFDISVNKEVSDTIICVEQDYYIRNESMVFFSFTNLFADENGNFTESRFIDGQYYSNGVFQYQG
jgi:hypothetical protein